MFRIGILGGENSHAMGFSQIFNGYRADLKGEFDDIRAVSVGGHYPEANREVYEKCGLETIVEKPEDMLGNVDAVMVTARDGRYHADFARPFIEAGIPAFVDKPFTSDPAEALALAKLAKSKGVPLAGGSALKLCADVIKLGDMVKTAGEKLRGGDIAAPVSLENEYGGFWFYSAHLVEICLRVFGYEPQWVWASRTPRGVNVVVRYTEFEVTNHFTESAYHYSGTIHTTDGALFQPINIDDFTALEARSFARMLRTGEMDFSYAQLVQPVYVLAAIEKSFRTGKKQYVERFTL